MRALSKIEIKLCQIYTKIYIYKILYKIVGLADHIQQIRKQSENDVIPEKHNKHRFAPIII